MVRITSRQSASGVILTTDGYVVTFMYTCAPGSRYVTRIPPGQSVSVSLSDGRTVSGVGIGSFSSAKNLNFDLVKITEDGVWPCAETGRAEDMKPGDTCLELGFPRGPDRSPSVRIGHLIPWGVSGMLRSSCFPNSQDDVGGGLFDLQGRLIGIHLYQWFSNSRRSKPTAGYLDIRIAQENWQKLARKRPSMEESSTRQPAARAESCKMTLCHLYRHQTHRNLLRLPQRPGK